MPYPILDPTLAALEAVKMLPEETEPYSVTQTVLVQTRNWLVDFLSQYFDDTTGLKLDAFSEGNLPLKYVRGTNPIDGAEREIEQGSIRTNDIADGVITAALLATRTITSQKIAIQSIRGEKFADESVTPDKMATKSVNFSTVAGSYKLTTSKFANAAILDDKLDDGAVLTTRFTDHAVNGTALQEGVLNSLLIGGQSVAGVTNCLDPRVIDAPFDISAEGEVTFTAGGLATAVLSLSLPYNQPEPGLLYGSGANVRGTLHEQWVIEQQTGAFLLPDTFNPAPILWGNKPIIGAATGRVKFRTSGTYLIWASALGFDCGTHGITLRVLPKFVPGMTVPLLNFRGTSATGTGTNLVTPSHCFCIAVIDVVVDPDTIIGAQAPYVEMRHYFENDFPSIWTGAPEANTGHTLGTMVIVKIA